MSVAWAFLRPLLPYLIGAAAIVGLLFAVHHDGYKQAEAHYKAEQVKADLAAEKKLRATEQYWLKQVSEAAHKYAGQVATIDRTATIIQPTIREVRSDPRYIAADCSLSDSVFAAINQARAASNTPAPRGDP